MKQQNSKWRHIWLIFSYSGVWMVTNINYHFWESISNFDLHLFYFLYIAPKLSGILLDCSTYMSNVYLHALRKQKNNNNNNKDHLLSWFEFCWNFIMDHDRIDSELTITDTKLIMDGDHGWGPSSGVFFFFIFSSWSKTKLSLDNAKWDQL